MELKGKYGSAKVFAETVDPLAVRQIEALLDQEFTAGSRIRIMPDVHAGAGCTIGTTMTVSNRAVPNLVGVDIGCGMETVRIGGGKMELQKLDRLIRERIPSGFDIREEPHRFNEGIDLTQLRCSKRMHIDRAQKSIGTLGGGNHFIEVDRDGEGAYYLVVHSGSRYLGLEVAKFYQQQAWLQRNRITDEDVRQWIGEKKAAGRDREIEKTVQKRKKQGIAVIPKDLACAEGQLFLDYIHDMKLVQHFAAQNRLAMVQEILKGMKWTADEQFTTVHNYIDTDSMILRKGAVSARAGERLLIPVNMRDGSLVCTGLGNEDWNCSAPHGAGRLMSRAAARQSFTLSQFKKEMQGVYTTSVGRETLDECPMAYKNMDEIVRGIEPTVRIDRVIRPVYNFKAGEEE